MEKILLLTRKKVKVETLAVCLKGRKRCARDLSFVLKGTKRCVGGKMTIRGTVTCVTGE